MKRKKLLVATVALSVAFLGVGCGDRDQQLRIAELGSVNVMVRNAAIEELGRKGVKAAVPKLCALTVAFYPPQTRLLSVRALGCIGDTNAVEVLVSHVRDSDKDVALASIESLGKIRDARAVTALVGCLNNTNLQLVAAWALGSIGDDRAVTVLTSSLSDDDKFVRYNASQALKRIGNRD